MTRPRGGGLMTRSPASRAAGRWRRGEGSMGMDRSELAARMAELRRLHVPTDRDAAVRAQLARLLEIDAGGAPVAGAPCGWAGDPGHGADRWGRRRQDHLHRPCARDGPGAEPARGRAAASPCPGAEPGDAQEPRPRDPEGDRVRRCRRAGHRVADLETWSAIGCRPAGSWCSGSTRRTISSTARARARRTRCSTCSSR